MRSGGNAAIIATIKGRAGDPPNSRPATLMTKQLFTQLLLLRPPLHQVLPRRHSKSGGAAAFCVNFRQKAHVKLIESSAYH